MGIFHDDSTAADKREAAVTKLLELCPAAYRVAFKPMVALATQNATDEQIASLGADIDRVRALADEGDMDGIIDIAKRYGATDSAISTYLPLFLPQAS